jgi:hypothetical protein
MQFLVQIVAVLCAFSCCCLGVRPKRSWGDDDEPHYQFGIKTLMNVSDIQENLFILETWFLPDVESNPGVQHWFWSTDPNNPSDKCYIITYAHHGTVSYYVASNNGF